MAINKLEEFGKNIDKEYGKSNTEKNIDYIMSLVKLREQPDKSIDDDIPVPSLQSTAEVIYIVMTRGDIPFEKFCEKDRGHKQVIEYVFIRGVKHRDEIVSFLKQLLSKSCSSLI